MKSITTSSFRENYGQLPFQIRERAYEAYLQFKEDSSHPSLRFKKIHSELPIYSVRISKNYRAVGQLDKNTIIWFWIGSHAEYDKLLLQLN